MRLCLYRGPANDSVKHALGHWLTRIATVSAYSHCELEIDGICFSSSIRDGGVRSRVIADLETSEHWDLFSIAGDVAKARAWFDAHDGQGYDWTGAAGSVLRWIPKEPNRWFCSEAIAASLGLEHPEKFTPQGLLSACL